MKKQLLRFLTFILIMSPLAQAAPVVYPTPQKANFPGGSTQVQSVEVQYVARGEDATLAAEGAYSLSITPGKLVVRVAKDDATALYYAKQTLSQLLEGVEGAQDAHKDPFPDSSLEEVAKLGELPLGEVTDYPDLPYRGVVEGYYGAPWSHEARLSQFEFYGRNKMNTYMYAPKDDPYHHGRGCYEPYPEKKAAEIRELVQAAHRNHVRFVWGIHPANTVNWAQDEGRTQLDALCGKLQMMYDLGVRDFAVLVDDSFGEIGKAERQVQLCNYLYEHFIRKHPDVNQTLIMCPTGYNRAWTNPTFLRTLGEGLHPSIPVMWTGNTVVNDITHESQSWVKSHVQRPTFIWWNWPCTDFKRSRLSMGRAYGMGTGAEMKELMSGFVANPMEQAEASKIGLFGVADYTWNITAFDSDRSWRDGIARLFPKDTAAMQTFCNHNSYLLPNNHGYYREESVEIAPVAEAFIRSLETEHPELDLSVRLCAEFIHMEYAGYQLLHSKTLGAIQKEIAPWLQQFALAGRAGRLAVEALFDPDHIRRLDFFFKGLETLSQMQGTTRSDWNNGRPKAVPDVEVAMHYMTPARIQTYRYINRSTYAELAGRKREVAVFSTNRGNAEKDAAALADSNSRTFWSTESRQQVGDWFCLDFGEPIDIRRVNLLMGGARAKDYAPAGQFEVSDDGKTWQPIGEERNGPAAVLNLGSNPVRARMVRFRITRAQNKWVSIYEFSVNRIVPPYVTNNLAVHPNITASSTDHIVQVNRVMEVFTINPGEFIDLEIPSLITPEWVEINIENPDLDWASIEFTLADGRRVPVEGKVVKSRLYVKNPLPNNEAVSSLRLTHVGEGPREMKITLFRIGIAPGEAAQNVELLTDRDLSTFIRCSGTPMEFELPITGEESEAIVVGTAECHIVGAEAGEHDEHVRRFRLPKGEKKLHLSVPAQSGKFISEVILK